MKAPQLLNSAVFFFKHNFQINTAGKQPAGIFIHRDRSSVYIVSAALFQLPVPNTEFVLIIETVWRNVISDKVNLHSD